MLETKTDVDAAYRWVIIKVKNKSQDLWKNPCLIAAELDSTGTTIGETKDVGVTQIEPGGITTFKLKAYEKNTTSIKLLRVEGGKGSLGWTSSAIGQGNNPVTVSLKTVNTAGVEFSKTKVEYWKEFNSLYIRAEFTITNPTSSMKRLYRSDFLAKKEGYNSVKAYGGGGGFSKSRDYDLFNNDSIEIFPGDTIKASFDFHTDDKGSSPSGWVIYYVKSNSDFIPVIKIQ